MILKMRHQSREKLNDPLGDLGERGITMQEKVNLPLVLSAHGQLNFGRK